MSIIVKLNIVGKQFNVLQYTYHINQEVNYNGLPSSKPTGGLINVILESSKDDLFEEWAISPNMAKDAEILMMSANMDRPSKKIRLSGTYLISKEEIFNSTNNEPAKMILVLSPDIFEEDGIVFNKEWGIGSLTSSKTPVSYIEDSEEEDTQVAIDIYIDSQTGHRFTEIKPNTNTYRIINYYDYTDILEEYPNRINGKEAINKLKSLSKEVRIDNAKIQQELQNISDKSRLTEYQLYIVLERNYTDPLDGDAVVTAERDIVTKFDERRDGKIKMGLIEVKGKNGKHYLLSPNSNMAIAEVHGHNKTQKSNTINVSGTSDADKSSATDFNINVYSLRAYEVKVGGQAKIDKVTGKGKESEDLGNTKGHYTVVGKENVSIGIFDIGLDALEYFSKR